ncbi:MAG: hypothetical protein IIY78_10465 [Clostridia bacterium]|nr:hypothetical protein [Clostridia bacterium]
MNIFFNSLRHEFSTANKVHIVWCAAILLIMLILAVLHHKWKDDSKKLRIWRLLCLVPLIICGVHAAVYVVGEPGLLGNYTAMYVIGVLALIPMLFAKRRTGYRITAVLTGLLTCLWGLYFCASSPNVFNHSRESYTESFHSLVRDMDRYYVLKEWKEVDFPTLEAKYLPMVEEAEKEQDPVKFWKAVEMFCNEMHDGHIGTGIGFDYSEYSTETLIPAHGFVVVHEHGLAMIQLDNNDVIAVCTSAEVNAVGIEDGTVITKWNGKPILQAITEDAPDRGIFPVKANADRVAALELSRSVEGTVEVSFIDKSGKEQTVTLEELEDSHTFSEARNAFLHTLDPQEDVNYSTKMLDDKCGYLRLNAEGTDSGLHDTIGYLTGEHKWAKEMFREKLRDLKSQGMEYLVIDLRNNMGGEDVIGYALCDLLTDKEWYCQGLGKRKNGEYISQSDQYIHGDGEFADLKVIALTNYDCASAGDGTSLLLSKLPNVTLAGITDPNGCDQEIGGFSVLSGGMVIVFFPTGLVLDEDGKPNIDTAADRVSRDPVEVRIPFDYDAAMNIFRDKDDYELDWAVKYVEDKG